MVHYMIFCSLVLQNNITDLRHSFYCGLKNLNEFKNLDSRTIAHLVLKLFLVMNIIDI